jgi:enamine deaminase RidA (YjgF/YER057c/UK114 family)
MRNVNPDELGPARGFSHATVAGNTVWLGGQIGSDAAGRVVEPGDLVAQFGRALSRLAIALRAAGCEPEDIVKLTYYVTDLKLYRDSLKALGPVYREVFGRHYPATTLVEVSSLFDPDALVEVDAVAVRRS